MKKNLWIISILAGLSLLTGCGQTTETTAASGSAETSIAPAAEAGTTADAVPAAEAENPAADNNISASDSNIIIITLYPDKAPITCENFENLVSQGF